MCLHKKIGINVVPCVCSQHSVGCRSNFSVLFLYCTFKLEAGAHASACKNICTILRHDFFTS